MRTKQPRFDLSSWRLPMRRADFRAYYRADELPFYRRRYAMVTMVIILLLIVMAVELFAWPLLTDNSNGVAVLEYAPWWLQLCPYIMAIWAMITVAVLLHGLHRDARFWRFCHNNGMTYQSRVVNHHWEGSAFVRPSGYNHLTAPMVSGEFHGETFTFGRYMLSDDGSENKELKIVRPFVFGRSSLPRKVPHIILKNKSSRIIPLIGAVRNNAYAKPEGDFADKFTIICPKNYEQDALMIFTPDVLAEIYDFASDAEIELIDDHLFIYTRHLSTFRQPEKFVKLCEILVGLDARFDKRTARYRDSFASIGKDEMGRRLRLSQTSILTIVWSSIIAIIIGYQVLSALGIGPFREWTIQFVQMVESHQAR